MEKKRGDLEIESDLTSNITNVHLQQQLISSYNISFRVTTSNENTNVTMGVKKKIKLKLPYTATGVASSRARTPGSCLPSNSSKLAPPPVEMWLITEATPTFSTAATESPPPMIVVTPFPLSSASFFATACKQWYNFNSLYSHPHTKRWQLHKMVRYFTSNLGMNSYRLVHYFR